MSRTSTEALVALLVLVLAGCSGGTKPDATAVAVPTGPDPAVLAAYDDALSTLAAGDELRGEAKLQAIATAHPDYAGPLVNLAVISARRNQLGAATAFLEKAVTVCANCAPAWNELGVLQRRQGRFADAERSYLNAITADGAYANAWFNLGVLYELYMQRPALALDHYARFRQIETGDPAGGDVDKWIADLKRRTTAVERSAQVEELE